jgi:hypothetical protein
MIAADSVATFADGEENGEDDEAASVDEGRRADTQEARAREDKDNGDRAQAETDAGSHEAESSETWCAARGRSEEEKGVMAGLGSFRRRVIKLLALQNLFRTNWFIAGFDLGLVVQNHVQ